MKWFIVSQNDYLYITYNTNRKGKQAKSKSCHINRKMIASRYFLKSQSLEEKRRALKKT